MRAFRGETGGLMQPRRVYPAGENETLRRGSGTVVLLGAVAIYSRSQDVRPSDEMRARHLAQGA